MFYGEPRIDAAILLNVLHFALVLAVWIYMYRQGAAARDLVFWGPVAYFIPVLGSIAAFVYFRRKSEQREKLT